MRKLFHAIILIVILIAMFKGCVYLNYYKALQLGDVKEIYDASQKLEFQVQGGDPVHNHGITIVVLGSIKGTAKLHLKYSNGQEMYSFDLKSGNVKLRLKRDWYEDKCLILYEPVDVTSGKLNIAFIFHS